MTSQPSMIEPLAERVDRLLLRHAELQRTNALLAEQVAALTQERDSLRSRLQAQFGADASLSLREREGGPGTEAVLELPCQPGAGAPAMPAAA